MPRDFGYILWPRPTESPRGHISPAEGDYIGGRAMAAALIMGVVTKVVWESHWPGDRAAASSAPWYAAGITLVLMWLLGYLHYRNRGDPPRPGEREP
jgi:hypothetical protein